MSDRLALVGAFDQVARAVLLRAADPEVIGDMWEDFPEIGEADWTEVCRHVERLLHGMGPIAQDEAYEFLTARAKDVLA